MKAIPKTGTVALVVRFEDRAPVLVECLSDDGEIEVLQTALQEGREKPLESVYSHRAKRSEEDEDFGDYVEDLLSQPFVRPEVQEHGVQWLRSKIKIEEFQRSEREATHVIAQYALKVLAESPWRTDFLLAGPTAKVRIRVFSLDSARTRVA